MQEMFIQNAKLFPSAVTSRRCNDHNTTISSTASSGSLLPRDANVDTAHRTLTRCNRNSSAYSMRNVKLIKHNLLIECERSPSISTFFLSLPINAQRPSVRFSTQFINDFHTCITLRNFEKLSPISCS